MEYDAINVRKGITPVVAIVMLLMLTIIVAGGVFAFLTEFIGQQEEETRNQFSTDIEFVDVGCAATSPGQVDFTLRNSGETDVDLTEVDFYVYDVSTGDLLDTPVTLSGPSGGLTVDGSNRHWQDSFTLDSEAMDSGLAYRVEAEFVSNDVGTASARCTAG